MAAASGPAAFAIADSVLTSWFGDIVLFLSLWGIWYHMLAGLRHLIWDAGYGLDLPSATRLGWSVIIGSVIMTLATVTFI
jgi:succinate dehydrogenase / fumarate reductase cytochrome b subunit